MERGSRCSGVSEGVPWTRVKVLGIEGTELEAEILAVESAPLYYTIFLCEAMSCNF